MLQEKKSNQWDGYLWTMITELGDKYVWGKKVMTKVYIKFIKSL